MNQYWLIGIFTHQQKKRKQTKPQLSTAVYSKYTVVMYYKWKPKKYKEHYCLPVAEGAGGWLFYTQSALSAMHVRMIRHQVSRREAILEKSVRLLIVLCLLNQAEATSWNLETMIRPSFSHAPCLEEPQAQSPAVCLCMILEPRE